ncbi:MAG: ATP-binding protein [Elusimicrobiota bacterium]|nr:ATP-binding protein [Elusimicrobiota bacterium]
MKTTQNFRLFAVYVEKLDRYMEMYYYEITMIKREEFLKPMRLFYEITDLVKVIFGIRRSGKSVLLTQIADELKSSGVDEKYIIFLNFELYEFSEIKTADDLNKFVMSKIDNKNKYYLFLDEIQNIENFELVVNSLRAQGNISIFITGSNAHLLSGELATHLSGRYIKFFVSPFTFAETLEISDTKDTKTVFENYFQWGGLPGRFAFKTEEDTRKYLQDVYDSIVLRDILSRSNIRDLNLLDNIIQFLLNNVGNIFSANTVAKYLKSQRRSVSAEALYNYIGYILSSLLINKVERYDIKGKNIFATLEKYYVSDIGLFQLKRANLETNLGGRLETIVANELLARGYDIKIGILRNSEIDFVAEKNGIRQYIQAAYTIDSDKTLNRELGAFKGIPDNFERILITKDNIDYSANGIKHYNIIEWLLKK